MLSSTKDNNRALVTDRKGERLTIILALLGNKRLLSKQYTRLDGRRVHLSGTHGPAVKKVVFGGSSDYQRDKETPSKAKSLDQKGTEHQTWPVF